MRKLFKSYPDRDIPIDPSYVVSIMEEHTGGYQIKALRLFLYGLARLALLPGDVLDPIDSLEVGILSPYGCSIHA